MSRSSRVLEIPSGTNKRSNLFKPPLGSRSCGILGAAGAGMLTTAVVSGVIGGAVGRGAETGAETGSFREALLAVTSPEAVAQDAAFSAVSVGLERGVGGGWKALKSAGQAGKSEAALLGRVEGAASGKSSIVSPTESRTANVALGEKAAAKSPGVEGAAVRSRNAEKIVVTGAAELPAPCFAAGTMVATVQGLRAIEDVKVGDLVLSRDEDSGSTEYRSVTRLFVTPEKELTSLTFEHADGTADVIEATPGHPFWVDGKGWTSARDLGVVDTVQTAESGLATLSATLSLDKRETVYNFEVEGTHTYFVGRGAEWVHNSCKMEVPGVGKALAEPMGEAHNASFARYKAELRAAQGPPTLGSATSSDYKATFFSAHAEAEGQVVVHHAVEQQALTRYPGTITEAQIHSLENLRGIPKDINANVHLSQIRKSWNQFYRMNPNPTAEQLLEHAARIDDQFGGLFKPPVR